MTDLQIAIAFVIFESLTNAIAKDRHKLYVGDMTIANSPFPTNPIAKDRHKVVKGIGARFVSKKVFPTNPIAKDRHKL